MPLPSALGLCKPLSLQDLLHLDPLPTATSTLVAA